MVIKRILNIACVFLLSNILLVINKLRISPILRIFLIMIFLSYFVLYNINPRGRRGCTARLEVLMGGRELLISSFILLPADICLYIYIFLFSSAGFSLPLLIINGIIALAVFLVLVWNGIIRMLCTSTQLSLLARLSLLFAWWVPVLNVILCCHCCRVVHREYLFIKAKDELDESRKESDVCNTKYPILLVHGIFWRDWQLFNYWGRIPKELIRNGAVIYYGNQQSAAPMEISAGELKNQILRILAQENCEKVNIIAHSKGGLDARYAISCLGMEQYVASLTTICTPHGGSKLLDKILHRIPESAVRTIARRYNALYKKLGDTEPDFYSGVRDLTTEQCAQFNKVVTNKENVTYQSIASEMDGFFSAGFPLNLGYEVLRRTDGENDGFVSVESSKWGDFLGCFRTKRKRGISHGDMIDLMRENIRGFDVCECYVDLVKGLKLKGL